MKIKLNDYAAFLDEMNKDKEDSQIRESIVRTSVLISQRANENSYFISIAYRRILVFKDPNQDEIIECQLFMGSAMFGNKAEIDEVAAKIKSKIELIENDFITLKLQKRNGTIY